MWIGGVRAIILDSQRRILMVRQCHESRDIWMVPGGGIESAETSMEAAVREVREETGLEVCIDRLIWHVEQITADGEQRFVCYFLGKATGGVLGLGEDPELGDDEQVLREVRFMSKKEIDQVKHLYPPMLRDELWKFLEEEDRSRNPYRIRTY